MIKSGSPQFNPILLFTTRDKPKQKHKHKEESKALVEQDCEASENIEIKS